MESRVTHFFVAEPHAVAAARHACEEICARVEPTLCNRLGLLVSELVTDAIRHAEGQRRPVRVRMHWFGRTVRLTIRVDERRFLASDGIGALRAGGWA